MTIFNSLKDESIQTKISKKYKLDKLSSFKNVMSTIKFIRNICAHGGVLFDLNMQKGISKLPHTTFHNNNNNQSINAGIKAMSFILESVYDYNNKATTIETEIYNLIKNKCNNDIRLIIENYFTAT